MQITEIAAATLIGVLFYNLSTMSVKNSGTMASTPEPILEDDSLYSNATDIKSRSPDDVCQVKPPEMISTSLLPAQNDKLIDDDFVAIQPDKLNNINFLNAGWSLGRDTTTTTMRNASYDLRSELPNPKILTLENNSFSNTTIDFMPKRSFEPETAGATLETKLSK